MKERFVGRSIPADSAETKCAGANDPKLLQAQHFQPSIAVDGASTPHPGNADASSCCQARLLSRSAFIGDVGPQLIWAMHYFEQSQHGLA